MFLRWNESFLKYSCAIHDKLLTCSSSLICIPVGIAWTPCAPLNNCLWTSFRNSSTASVNAQILTVCNKDKLLSKSRETGVIKRRRRVAVLVSISFPGRIVCTFNTTRFVRWNSFRNNEANTNFFYNTICQKELIQKQWSKHKFLLPLQVSNFEGSHSSRSSFSYAAKETQILWDKGSDKGKLVNAFQVGNSTLVTSNWPLDTTPAGWCTSCRNVDELSLYTLWECRSLLGRCGLAIPSCPQKCYARAGVKTIVCELWNPTLCQLSWPDCMLRVGDKQLRFVSVKAERVPVTWPGHIRVRRGGGGVLKSWGHDNNGSTRPSRLTAALGLKRNSTARKSKIEFQRSDGSLVKLWCGEGATVITRPWLEHHTNTHGPIYAGPFPVYKSFTWSQWLIFHSPGASPYFESPGGTTAWKSDPTFMVWNAKCWELKFSIATFCRQQRRKKERKNDKQRNITHFGPSYLKQRGINKGAYQHRSRVREKEAHEQEVPWVSKSTCVQF